MMMLTLEYQSAELYDLLSLNSEFRLCHLVYSFCWKCRLQCCAFLSLVHLSELLRHYLMRRQ